MLVLASMGCPTDGGETEARFAVTYDPGDGGGTAPNKQMVAPGTEIVMYGQGSMTPPEGKPVFVGWKTGGTTYESGMPFTVNADVVFIAQWKAIGAAGDDLYTKFHNYPTGRVDQNGLLEIKNTIASEVLLFTGTVEQDNYIGTVSSLGSVHVKLPDEKFYTIIGVEKKNYEERQSQASQFNVLTYYSNTQGYSVSVSPSSTYGAGNWVFNNNTSYWVQIKKADLSQNYAVIAPNAQRVIIPIPMNTPHDYLLYFSKELKYNGKVVALVETTDISQANTAQATDTNPTYTTSIQTAAGANSSIKPAVMVQNQTNKSIRVYYANNQKTNGAAGGDLVITGGTSQLVSGFEINDTTNVIEFSAIAWAGQNKKVPVTMPMLANKVYEITIPNSENAADITVTEAESSKYYN
jgi:hypothetical protein